MAVSKRVYRLCQKYFLEDKSIAELGSQFVVEEEWGSYGPPYFKDVFSNLKLTSFDFYPENNATVIDLSNPIDKNLKNNFDIVTNFGTTEHVQNQYVCWKNIFDMLKIGGLSINEIPKKNNWPGHCKYYFDESTVESLKKDFETIEIQDVNYPYPGAGDLLFFVLKKKHDLEFMTTENELMQNILTIENHFDQQGH
jgi:hypothetical protein